VAGNPSAAESAFIEAATREPWQPLFWRNIGIVQLQQGKSDRAAEALERAIGADPYDGSSHGLLARILYSRAEYARAAQEGEQQVLVAPTDVDAYDVPYRAYVQLDRLADAERLLVQGLQRVNSAHLHVLLARVYANTGRGPDAVEQVALALAVDPKSSEALELRDQLSGAR
jgi:tetratricopeptide (TPR) repeat protein